MTRLSSSFAAMQPSGEMESITARFLWLRGPERRTGCKSEFVSSLTENLLAGALTEALQQFGNALVADGDRGYCHHSRNLQNCVKTGTCRFPLHECFVSQRLNLGRNAVSDAHHSCVCATAQRP